MSATLKYRVYRAELATNGVPITTDSKMWTLVAEVTPQNVTATGFIDSPVLEFTDTDVEFGKMYLWRVTIVDSLGNESAALLQRGLTIRRQLERSGSLVNNQYQITGKILVGYAADSAPGTSTWIYTLGAVSPEDVVGDLSARWKLYTGVLSSAVPGVEQLYRWDVEPAPPPVDPEFPPPPPPPPQEEHSPKLPTPAVVAAIAHGGSGAKHLSQAVPVPYSEGGKVVDFFDFSVNDGEGHAWTAWRSHFGENLASDWYESDTRLQPEEQYALTIDWRGWAEIAVPSQLTSGHTAVEISLGANKLVLVYGQNWTVGTGSGSTLANSAAANLATAVNNSLIGDLVTASASSARVNFTIQKSHLAPLKVTSYWLDAGAPRLENTWRAVVWFSTADTSGSTTFIVDGSEGTLTAGLDFTPGVTAEATATAFKAAAAVAGFASKVNITQSGSVVTITALTNAMTGSHSGGYDDASVTETAVWTYATVTTGTTALAPSAGQTISLWGSTALTFATSGTTPGSGKVLTYTGSATATLEDQLRAIATAINENLATPLPIKATLEGMRVILRTTDRATWESGVGAMTPATNSTVLRFDQLTKRSTKFVASDGGVDSNLLNAGEGSGAGYWTAWGDQPAGHIHLRVNWNDLAAERDIFSVGRIYVDGQFWAEYRPGSLPSMIDYVIPSVAGKTLPADGITPVTVEVVKYHPMAFNTRVNPMSWQVTTRVVKVCPKRTAVNRRGSWRPASGELVPASNIWDLKVELTFLPAAAWFNRIIEAHRPRWQELEMYLPDAAFGAHTPTRMSVLDYQTAQGQSHPDIASYSPAMNVALWDSAATGVLEAPVSFDTLVLNDDDGSFLWQQAVGENEGQDLLKSGSYNLRLRLWDAVGTNNSGKLESWSTGNRFRGNASLWSMPVQPPAVDRFSWLIKTSGTASYLAKPTGYARAVPSTASFTLRSQGLVGGWRDRVCARAVDRKVIPGILGLSDSSEPAASQLQGQHPRMVKGERTIDLSVTGIGIWDWGDKPLLADGETAYDEGDRHEVATTLPRTTESNVPYRIEHQHVFSNSGTASQNLVPGLWILRYGYGGWQVSPDQLWLRLRVEAAGKTLLAIDAAAGRPLSQLGSFEVSEDTEASLVVDYPDGNRVVELSLMLISSGLRRVAVERPEVAYHVNDFINWPDADDPQGRRTGAPRSWPNADSTIPLFSGARWHNADFADSIPAGDYPLTPKVIDIARDGYEAQGTFHDFRSDVGGLVQTEYGVYKPGVAAPSAGWLKLMLTPLTPVSALDFTPWATGWGRNDPQVTSIFMDSGDNRMGLVGLETQGTWLYGPLFNLASTAFKRIVVATNSPFKLWWQTSGGTWTQLTALTRLGGGAGRELDGLLFSTSGALPVSAPRRLALEFPADGLRHRVWGVWVVDEIPQWELLVTKNGSADSTLTGSTSWRALSALSGALALESDHHVAASGVAAGTYNILARAKAVGASALQTSGNTTLPELPNTGLTETNLGLETKFVIEVA